MFLLDFQWRLKNKVDNTEKKLKYYGAQILLGVSSLEGGKISKLQELSHVFILALGMGGAFGARWKSEVARSETLYSWKY